MENRNKRQEIFDLVKKGLSLSLATLIVTANMTACDIFNGPVSSTTNEPGYNETDFGDIVDPTKPLTPEQIEKVEKAEDCIEAFDYDLRDKGLGTIIISNIYPSNGKQYCATLIPKGNNSKYNQNNLIFDVDETAYKQCEALAKNALNNNINGIASIDYETHTNFSIPLKEITIKLDDNPNPDLINKLLNILEPYIDFSTYLKDVQPINSEDSDSFYNWLSSINPAYKNNIHSVRFSDYSLLQPNKPEIELNIIPQKPTGSADYDSMNAISIKLTPEEFEVFKKYFTFEEFYNYNKVNFDDNTYFEMHDLLFIDMVSDALKDQALNDIYKLCISKNLINDKESYIE